MGGMLPGGGPDIIRPGTGPGPIGPEGHKEVMSAITHVLQLT